MLRLSKVVKNKFIQPVSLKQIENLERQLQEFIKYKDASRKDSLKKQINIILDNDNANANDNDSLRIKKLALWINNILQQLDKKHTHLNQ